MLLGFQSEVEDNQSRMSRCCSFGPLGTKSDDIVFSIPGVSFIMHSKRSLREFPMMFLMFSLVLDCIRILCSIKG